MIEQKNRLCLDCSGRWDVLKFWHSCPSTMEASTENWGYVHCRKFVEIKSNRQCSFCQLVCEALTNGYRYRGPDDDQMIYFSKRLFGEYEARESYVHSTGSQLHGPGVATLQKHQINHLCVSTFPNESKVGREFVRLIQSGTHLCKVYEGHIALLREPNHDHYFLHGRRIDPTFNTNLACQWIDLCGTAHAEKCSPRLTPRTRWPLRVINVKERKIQYTPSSCSYVALSYRWPTSTTLTLTSATEARLIENGGLADHFDDIPPIIKDSITLSEKVGQTYLWVDSICIPQEEKNQDPSSRLAEERTDQLKAMKDIYHRAHFTIVACLDPNSGRGLPGIQEGSRHPQKSEEIGNLAYTVVKAGLHSAVKQSVWNSRIWTFQEAAASRRLMIFTNHQVFFHCNDSIWYEDTFLERPPQWDIRETDPVLIESPYWKNRDPSEELKFWEWTDAVEEYTRRETSRESDFPRGLDFIKTMNSSFICCLPKKYFAQALRFKTWRGRRGLPDSATWCLCGWRVPGGVCYKADGAPEDKSEYAFLSCHFYRLEKDSPGIMLLPIEIDGISRLFPARPQPFPDELDIFSILSSAEITNLVMLHTCIVEGSLLPGSEGIEGDCQISLLVLDDGANSIPAKVLADAILSLDCGKQKGDPVECVYVGLDFFTTKVWLLLIERDGRGISHRIGTATIDSDDWQLIAGPLQIVYLI